MRVRPAAVAGYFYPEEPEALRCVVRELLADNPEQGSRPEALVVPHAGYPYSGPVAAHAYNRLAPHAAEIRRVALLGPAHRVALRGMALPDVDAFATPLGLVNLDSACLARLPNLPGVGIIPEAHAAEHSLEVQLPFLQMVLGEFELVPLVVGTCEPQSVAALIESLWKEHTLILVSSDLSHYHPYREARRRDRQTCERILACDPLLGGEQACGCQPLNGLLLAARQRRLQVQLLDLRNSGDTGGDREAVVGYGAWAFVTA